jgi:hypothetical protein
MRARRVAGHHPDSAVRMVGIAALIHGKWPVVNSWILRFFAQRWRAPFLK